MSKNKTITLINKSRTPFGIGERSVSTKTLKVNHRNIFRPDDIREFPEEEANKLLKLYKGKVKNVETIKNSLSSKKKGVE